MSDFNIQFEEQDQSITLEFEQIGGGAVKSVNGKVGEVVLGASDVGALPSSTSIPAVDNTLTVAGAAADAKKTGDELSSLKEDISPMQTATASDVGKALKAKTVEDGKVTAWEFGDTGATTDIHVDGTSLVINTSVVDGNEVNF